MEPNQYLHFMITQALVESLKDIFSDSTKDHMPIIFKLCSGLSNQQDLEHTIKFFVKIYEAGYMKSLEAHKVALEKAGFQTAIVANQNLGETQKAYIV